MKNTKIFKLFLFALFLSAFFIIFSCNSKVNASITLKVKGADNYLTVRSEESPLSTVLGILYNGDTVEVDYIDKTTGLAKLSSSNFIRKSYGSKEYIKLDKEAYCGLSYLKLPSKRILYKTQAEIPVYQDYSTNLTNNSKKLTTIEKGKIIKIVGENDYWAKLSNGGYCLKKDLKRYSGSTRYVYNTSLLNVRSAPYLSGKIKNQLKGGSTVVITEIFTTKDKNGNELKWAKLKNGNYCCFDYLITAKKLIEKEKEADNFANSQQYINSDHIYFVTSRTEKRTGAGLNYNVAQVLDTFSTFEAVDYINGWFKTSDGYYILGENVAAQISRIDIYLANFSTTNGKIVLTCSNGKQMVYPACGGTPDYPTPLGSFSVLLKQEHCTSGSYPSADGKNNMERSLFFKMENGYAIHCASPYIPSHGCIHVEDSIQEKIFKFTNVGCPVNISQNVYK